MACLQRAASPRRQEREVKPLSDSRPSSLISTVIVVFGPQYQSYPNSNTSESPQKVAESNLKIYAVHHVVPISTRAVILKWMVKVVGCNSAQKIASKTVLQFPFSFFARAHMQIWHEHWDYGRADSVIWKVAILFLFMVQMSFRPESHLQSQNLSEWKRTVNGGGKEKAGLRHCIEIFEKSLIRCDSWASGSISLRCDILL